jgi:hypothetical protein
MSKSVTRATIIVAALLWCVPVAQAQTPSPTSNCTYTLGYWKTHPEAWPSTCLNMTIGGCTYCQTELLAILNQPVQGDGAMALAHQLIPAMLNVAEGANGLGVAPCIAVAQSLLTTGGSSRLMPIGNGPWTSLSLTFSATTEQCLENFNTGLTGPGHCLSSSTATIGSTWGAVKTIYR